MDARSQLLQQRPFPHAQGWPARSSIAYPVLLILALALTFRFGEGPSALHGDLTIYWVWADQFGAQLAHGNLYPRWLPASDAGLGTPVFYFYPPVAFYLVGAFQLAGLSNYASLIAVFGIAFAVSGVASWHWLRGRSNYPLLGAAFFMAAPYHLLNYTDRAALAESVAIAIVPLLAIGLRRIADGRSGVVFTALAYAALICTHLPLALLVSVFLVAPYALLHRARLTAFAVAVASGIALAAIYLVPAFALQQYRDVGQLYRTPNLQTPYWSLFSRHWEDAAFTATFMIVGTAVAAALVPALVRRDRWAIHALAVAMVITGVVPFIWSLPLLRDVQFPFRTLPIVEFGLATALARLPRKPSLVMVPFALPLIVSLMVLPGFHFGDGGLQRLRARHPDAYEYLPKGVLRPGQTNATLDEVLSTRVPPPRVPGMVVEPHFYFPAWSCGEEEPRTQLLMHGPSCSPVIVWTWAEKIGAVLSLLAALLLAAAALRGPVRRPIHRKMLASLPTAP